MKISVLREIDHQITVVEVRADSTILMLKTLIHRMLFASEPVADGVVIKHDGQIISGDDRKLIRDLKVVDNDLIAVSYVHPPKSSFPASSIGSAVAGLNGFSPNELSAQMEIERNIREANIARNMEMALEHFPETFASVTMLFIACKVNGHPIKAFIDTGAQSSIMSSACAKKCGLMRLVDERFQGIALGIGTQAIIGRVHIAQLEIASIFVNATFNILDNQAYDVIIGLDLLKRHQCSVDLENNCLFVKTDNGKVRTPFLPEREIPNEAREIMKAQLNQQLRGT